MGKASPVVWGVVFFCVVPPRHYFSGAREGVAFQLIWTLAVSPTWNMQCTCPKLLFLLKFHTFLRRLWERLPVSQRKVEMCWCEELRSVPGLGSGVRWERWLRLWWIRRVQLSRRLQASKRNHGLRGLCRGTGYWTPTKLFTGLLNGENNRNCMPHAFCDNRYLLLLLKCAEIQTFLFKQRVSLCEVPLGRSTMW